MKRITKMKRIITAIMLMTACVCYGQVPDGTVKMWQSLASVGTVASAPVTWNYPSNLLARWSMESNFIDSIGSCVASNVGATFTNDAKFGLSAGYFAGVRGGTDVYIQATNTYPSCGTNFSLSLWVKFKDNIDAYPYTAVAGFKSGNFSSLILGGAHAPWAAFRPYYGATMFNDGLALALTTVGSVFTTALDSNVWRHVCITYGDNLPTGRKASVYKDGIFVEGYTTNLTGVFSSNFQPRFGYLWTSIIPNDEFNGLMDEITLFSRALTSNEVYDIFTHNPQ